MCTLEISELFYRTLCTGSHIAVLVGSLKHRYVRALSVLQLPARKDGDIIISTNP